MRHQAGDAIDRKDKQRGQRQNAANQRSIQSQDCGLLQELGNFEWPSRLPKFMKATDSSSVEVKRRMAGDPYIDAVRQGTIQYILNHACR